jgi:hypothetical protein
MAARVAAALKANPTYVYLRWVACVQVPCLRLLEMLSRSWPADAWRLSVSRNKIGADGARALAEALQTSATARTLDLA